MHPTTPSRRNPLGRRCPALAAGLLSAIFALVGAANAAASVTAPPPPAAAATSPVSPLRLEVNIPAYRLDAFLDDQLVASYPITAGKTREPTVTGKFEIRQVIWNPWWHPPANRRPKDKVTPPGPRNPMGRVKLQFSGLYYIHGTSRVQEIGRAASRGCVRMRNEDVMELARLVHRHASPDLSADTLDALAADPRRTRHLRLSLPVPVQIVYRTVEVRDGGLAIHRDVYRQETLPLRERVQATLAASGIAADGLDGSALETALAALPSEGGFVPLTSAVEVASEVQSVGTETITLGTTGAGAGR